jgi:hypothetical protein
MSTCSDTQNLHHAHVTLKRRNWLIFLAFAAIAVALFLVFAADSEPEYEGRPLSEWLAQCDGTVTSREKIRPAVRHIGTNAVPYLLKWISYETPSWRKTLYNKLPPPIRFKFQRWLQGKGGRQAECAIVGFMFLGTNAVTAIPQLEALMNDNTKAVSSVRAIFALGNIGEPAIPVLQSALADSNHLNPELIVMTFECMASTSGTNVCLPLLREALSHKNSAVRDRATNALERLERPIPSDGSRAHLRNRRSVEH